MRIYLSGTYDGGEGGGHKDDPTHKIVPSSSNTLLCMSTMMLSIQKDGNWKYNIVSQP